MSTQQVSTAPAVKNRRKAERILGSRMEMLLNRLRSLTTSWSEVSDPEGAVQNGLIGAWLAARRFDLRRAKCFYLYMRNAAEWCVYTTARRERKHLKNRAYPPSENESTESWLARIVTVQPSAERRLTGRDTLSMLEQAIEECLTERERAAVMRWAESEDCCMERSSDRVVLERAQRKLRGWFTERGIHRLSELK